MKDIPKMNDAIGWPYRLATGKISMMICNFFYLKFYLINFVCDLPHNTNKRIMTCYRQKILPILFLSVALTGCAFQGGFIPIHTIRIEDMQIQKIFKGNADIENLYARWQGSRIDLLQQSPNQQKTTIMATYSLADEYIYRSRSATNIKLIGTIYSMKKNGGVSWKEIKKSSENGSDDLVLVIEPEVREDKFVDMVYIPGGSFNMGSTANKDEQPVHPVIVNGFYMDKYEVTVAQFREFCKATRRNMPQQPYWNSDKNPVVNASWNDAAEYAKWKHKRLPTEAEWEYAARSAIKGYFYSWGNVDPDKKKGGNVADETLRSEKQFWTVWKAYFDGYVYTAPVGSFYCNTFGLYDMTGNASEWCADWYDENYYKSSAGSNPRGPEKGSHKVIRGGSWNLGPREVRTTKRLHFRPDVTLDYIGFRCVQDK
jgi:sulfatase modifying factor 1